MTFREIYTGSAIGLMLTVLGSVGVLPQPFMPFGLFVVIFSIIAGGVDGTLPRMR